MENIRTGHSQTFNTESGEMPPQWRDFTSGAKDSSHTSGVRQFGRWWNQGCRCAPPLANLRAAFQAAFARWL